jgi:putative membrane protein
VRRRGAVLVHDHGGAGGSLPLVLLIAGAAAAALVYVAAAVRDRVRRTWPVRRCALWVAGVLAAGAASAGPLGAAAHDDFVAHVASHVLLGMVAPLLLVLAAPITLALRTLHPVPARRLSRLLRSPLVRPVAHPVTAAVLDMGGLWLLYASPLFEAMRGNALLMVVVNAHMLIAGCLFMAAIIGPDPNPHRASFGVRAAVLVAAVAAHDILAKVLYAQPPGGVPAAEAEAGAQLMYYAGDAVHVVVIVLLCRQWYAATAPGRRAVAHRRLPT